jgi:hypothetical protein
LQGLSHKLSLSDVTGTRISVNLTRTGFFACSSVLITRIYDTTINNYLGLTTGSTHAHTATLQQRLHACHRSRSRHRLCLMMLQAACPSIVPIASAGDTEIVNLISQRAAFNAMFYP